MKKHIYSVLLLITILSLLLGACGPSRVQNVQPIKFEHLQQDGTTSLVGLNGHGGCNHSPASASAALIGSSFHPAL